MTIRHTLKRALLRRSRIVASLAGLIALALVGLVLSISVRGQGPAVATSATNDPSSAAAPWEWPTPDARPLQIDRGAAGLWQTLLKLHTRASLLMLVAHPDDEDGGMLAYESRGQGARAILLTLNRGEGGQNVMSDDFWDALGLVRTRRTAGSRPLLRCAAVLGHRGGFRIFENARGSARSVGARPAARGCGARGADDAAAGDYFGVRRTGLRTVTGITPLPGRSRRRCSRRPATRTCFRSRFARD